MDEYKTKIRMLVSPYLSGCELADNQDIFALDGVSSLFALQLVLLIEKGFKIKLAREDLDFDNFRSVNALANLVQRKLEGVH